MKTKQNIHVNRYPDPAAVGGWECSITPEDRSFVVFVPTRGDALFYRRTTTTSVDGAEEHAYADVEFPSVVCDEAGAPALPPATGDMNLIDFTTKQQSDGTWTAWLNVRHIGAEGPTEMAAVKALMNYVVQLCSAGCLDHTGRPCSPSTRRRAAVFGA